MRQASSTSLSADICAAMIEMRRHLHRHPELSNEERETQSYILDRLQEQNVAGAQPAAGTGVVVDIVGRKMPSNRCVAIRADIDALPIREATGLDFASLNDGVMHACGHDAHTAMVFAAMTALHRERDTFSGTVRFIFQPAEEAEPLGGRRIVEEGWLDGVDSAIGIHVDPYLATGYVAVGEGPYTLACDTFDIVVRGAASHAAKPHEGTDALGIGCAIVTEINRIVAREAGPFDALVVSVTRFNAGHSYNILADEARISGTIRSGQAFLRERALARVEKIADGIASAHEATIEFSCIRGEPPVVNNAEMVRIIREAVEGSLGPEALVSAPGWEAADDFGFISQRVPSVYFRLGVRDPQSVEAYPLHHPKMTVDEDAMKLGATTLLAAARRWLILSAAQEADDPIKT
jgi:amidohydrolase